jgi:hypothetical protein
MGDGRRHRHRPTSAGDYGTFSPNGTNTAVPLLDDQGSANRPLSSVPEPTTLLLLASGAAGFVSWMRRRM